MSLKGTLRRWRSRAAAATREARHSPTLIAISAEGFLARLGFGIIGFALPLYALSLGMGLAEVGLLYALRALSTVLVKPGMGWAADRFGHKPILMVAVSLRCLVGALLIFATLPWHLCAIRLLQGVMTAAREPSAAALIAEHGDRHRMASAFAWYTTARDLGRSFGYAAAGLLIQATGDYRVVFSFAFLASCAALFTAGRYVREGLEAPERRVLETAAAKAAPVRRPSYRGLYGYAAFGFMVAGSAEMMRGFFPVIATRYASLTEAQAGLAVSAASVAVLLGGPLFGWLSDHVSRALALGARSAANTVSSLLYVFFPTFPGFLVARLIDDTGKAAFRPTWGAILAEVSEGDRTRRARTMTFVDTGYTLGEVLGPLAAGALMASFGAPVMLAVRAGASLATEVQAVLVFRRRRPATQDKKPLWRRAVSSSGALLLLVVIALGAMPLPAQAETPVLRIPRVDRPPEMEDFLGVHRGGATLSVSGFRQREPGDGVPVSQATTAYLSYDSMKLYVVFVCKDDRAKVRASIARREEIGADDQVAVYLDTFLDRERAYVFATNPLGIQRDGILTEGQDEDVSFDAVWASEGRLTDDGYVVRMAIPFRSLRFRNGEAQAWGVALGRVIQRNNEEAYWPHITKRVQGFVPQLGALNGLAQISPGRNVQVNPYSVLARARFLDADAPAFRNAQEERLGLDAKVVVRDALTVDATLNPDFSQVESDDPQATVNERFEVFFPEKRPFFIENAGYFQTPVNLLFSRRIVDAGFGLRLTGKLGRWAVGALAMNDRAPGRLPPTDLLSGRDAGVGALRVQRELGEESNVGLLVTDREFGDGFSRIFSVDGRLKAGENWAVVGQLVRSETREPDATRSAGSAALAQVVREGRNFDYQGSYQEYSPDFAAPLGFVRRVGFRQTDHELKYRWRPEGSTVLKYGPELSVLFNWNPHGRQQDREIKANFEVELKGNTELKVERVEAFELFEGLPFRPHASAASVTTDWLKWLALSGSYAWGAAVNHDPPSGLAPSLGRATEAEVNLTLRPTPRLRLDQTFIHSALRTRDGSSPIFTDRHLRVRLNYQFNRMLSLRALVDYTSLDADPTLADLERERAWAVDLLLTCLVHPGTALYVGYTNHYENLAMLPGPPATLRRIASPDTSVGRQLFVKLSYLWRF